MFEKEAEDFVDSKKSFWRQGRTCIDSVRQAYQKGAEFGYNKANEWHNLNENYKDLPNEGEWVEGLYLWYYKDEPKWDVFKVRWCELDEKLVRWYSYDENNLYENKIDEPDYWRKITLPIRSEYDRGY